MRHAKGREGGRVCFSVWVAIALLMVPTLAFPLTRAGTVISHSFQVRFGTPAVTVTSNETKLTVLDVVDPTIVPSRSAVTLPGQPIDFLHTVSNNGNAPDSFTLSAAIVSGALAVSGPPIQMEFFQKDGQTPVPHDANGLPVVGPVPAGGSVDIVFRVVPPAGSEGRQVNITLKAVSQLTSTRSSSITDQLAVPVPSFEQPVKSVFPAGSVLPGALLTYTISITNNGNAAATNVVLSDPLDPLIDLVPGSASVPAGITATSSYDDATRTLFFRFPSVPTGFSGSVTFKAQVHRTAVIDGVVSNTAAIVTDQNPTPQPSTTTLTPILGQPLVARKGTTASGVETGDIFPYWVSVENTGAVPINHVMLRDYLPRGFRYLKSSSVLDGSTFADPVVSAGQLAWDIGTLAPGQKRTMVYRVVVSGEAPLGNRENRVIAEGTTPAGTSTASLPATASVLVRSSVLGSKAIILGRVFVDANCNGIPDAGEAGVAGVRIYLDDGSFTFTDPDGQYSFTGISSGNRVVKIDRSTLAGGLRPVPFNTAFAGVGWSQFITVPFGGPARGDFALVQEKAAPEPPPAPVPAAPLPTSTDGIGPGPARSMVVNKERDWIMVGIGSLTVGGKSVTGHVEPVDKDDRFERGFFHDERLSFFTRGKILGKYLLTAAYDSGKERREGLFQQIDPEKYYPVYGDASDIGYEAQSAGKLYVKLEAGRSYILGGDYRTDLSENEFSRYDRALNGVKLEINEPGVTVKGFESTNKETLIREEFAGNGTSGYFFLSRRPVFENSERVRIETRDRYHSERVLSVVEKVRYADYSIDYASGGILFKQPVPSTDKNLNPITVVVTYQSEIGGEERRTYGGRATVNGKDGSYFGGTAVVEEQSVKNSTLYALDGALKLGGEKVVLKGEGAVSDNLDHGTGSAWKAELFTHPTEKLDLGGYYRKVEADFFNPSMTGNETGTTKYGGRGDYRLDGAVLHAESFVERNELLGTRLFGNDVGLARKFSLLDAEGGFKHVEEEKSGLSGHSDLIYAGVKAPLTKKLDATLRREQLLAPSNVSDYQTKNYLRLDYRLNDRTRAFVAEEYQEGSPKVRQSTLFGMESKLSERMRVATGYQMSSGIDGESTQANVDLNTKLYEEGGFSLDSRTGYQLENSLSADRGQAILGLNSRYQVSKGILLSSSFERVQTVQGSGGTGTAFTLGGEYLREKDLKVTGRYEVKTGPGEFTSLYAANVAYKASRSLTLLGKSSFWDRDADAGEDIVYDGYVGAAWRPLAGNPLHLLSLARFKMEARGSVPGGIDSKSLILSTEPTFRMNRRWTLQGKYAGKLSLEGSGPVGLQSYTDLVLAGASFDLAEKWELSAYGKLTNQYDTELHGYGAVGSVGYRVYRNVVVMAGYNYARIDDRDLTGESFQGQGPFIGLKVKFDEEMFEREEKALCPPKPLSPPVSEIPKAAPAPPAPVPVLVPAVAIVGIKEDIPLQISGSAELLTLLVNGEKPQLPSTEVTVTRERIGSLELQKGKLKRPVRFTTTVEKPELVKSWRFGIVDAQGRPVYQVMGEGTPPAEFVWNGVSQGKPLAQGEIYQYRLELAYADGSSVSTGRGLFGINLKEATVLSLAGGAFVFERWELTDEARRLLKEAARLIKAHPKEKVIVEGHTDAIGTVAYNMDLSRKRCDSAANYLVRVEGIADRRIIRRWYGKTRPVADNVTTPGRRLNRRAEVKGDFGDDLPVNPDRFRTAPFVVINGKALQLDRDGRFATTLPGDVGTVKVEMGDSMGRSLATTLPIPSVDIASPAAETLVPHGVTLAGYVVDADGKARCTLNAGTDPGNLVKVEGRKVPVDGKGGFSAELPLEPGEKVFGMVLRNGSGCSRLLNLRVRTAPRTVESRSGS